MDIMNNLVYDNSTTYWAAISKGDQETADNSSGSLDGHVPMSKCRRATEPPKCLGKHTGDLAFRPVVTLAQQKSSVIPVLPPDGALTNSHLSERSAAPNSAPPLLLASRQSVSEKERRFLSCYLELPLEITDREEFIRFMAPESQLNGAWIIKHTKTDILQSELTVLMIYKHHLKFDDIPEAALTPELALQAMKRFSSWRYESLPARLKTPEFNECCLEAGLLPVCPAATTALPDPEIYYAALVDRNTNYIKYVPLEYQSFVLCKKAILNSPHLIKYIKPSVPRYEELCILAVKAAKSASFYIPDGQITQAILTAMAVHGPLSLANIPEHLITYQHCHDVLQNRETYSQATYIPARIFQQHPELAELILERLPSETCPHILEALPDKLKTEDFCRRFLNKWPKYIAGCPLPLLRKHPEWVKRSLKFAGRNLMALPESERSFDLCQRALTSSYPYIRAVPVTILADHHSLLLLAASLTFDLSIFPDHLITPDVCIASLSVQNPACAMKMLSLVPEAVREALPYDLLLAVAPGFLPLEIREAMFANGDTTLPPPYRQKKPIMDQRYLMSPHVPFGELRYSSGLFLQKILLSTGPFTLRNLSRGHALQHAIKSHYHQRESELLHGRLPFLERPIDKKSSVYGGRTLMFRTGDKVTRMKFLRHEESLNDFFREEAVHRFTHQQRDLQSLLKSEVPEHVGVKLVPLEYLPDNILSSFRSKLETYSCDDEMYYLVYEFTTRDEDYSTLAHQKDHNGDSTRAEQGLLKACHDLGVWSSLGAVHTSTINASHNFAKKRRELFLCFMFCRAQPFPGAITGWDTRATDESDWAYSGLKDIGDMEFYPQITSYFDTTDADLTLPVGVDQRAAFINASVENMIAPILHYARMHRDDADYHYKNSAGRAKLGLFINDVISTYSSGLLGWPVKAEDCFESRQIHQKWVNKTTAETALWTARQNHSTDCFAKNLEQTGHYSEELYPDQEATKYRYPKDFTSNGQDNLGCNNGEFALSLLIRGLYQVGAFLAARLGG